MTRKGGRPTLSLSFQDELGELITKVQATQTRVPPFFANLLPEGPLREYLAERAGVHPDREFFLLWVLGRDLPGAITIRPADEPSSLPRADAGSGVEMSGTPSQALHFSLAGVQLKFSAIQAADRGRPRRR